MALILKFVYIMIIFLFIFITEIKGGGKSILSVFFLSNFSFSFLSYTQSFISIINIFLFIDIIADRCRSIIDCHQRMCWPLLTLVCVNFVCDCVPL